MNWLKKACLAAGLTICSIMYTLAQSEGDKKKDIAAYNKAFELALKADKTWKSGDYAAAEKQFRQSLATYPVLALVNQLPLYKMQIGDANGANAEWNAILKAINTYPSIMVNYPGLTIFKSIYKYEPVDKFHLEIYKVRASANALSGDMKQTLIDYFAMEKLGALDKDGYGAFGITAVQLGDFETARRCIDTLNKMFGEKRAFMDKQLSPVYVGANLALAEGNYEQAIALCDRMEKEDKGMNTTWRAAARMITAQAYAKSGNIEQARVFLDLAIKHVALSKTDPEVAYTAGLIDLAAKAYESAIAQFKAAFEYKPPGFTANPKYSWAKYRYLTGRAEAYMGLKEYDKARSDYELALLYNSDHLPAINGLAHLESKLIQETKLDKNPPEIIITEPAIKRGLKITAAGTTVMIKGIAKDPSGLKQVTINGNKVYAQNGGDFWGDVKLADGVNKFALVAEDVAGNKAELIFEIEKAVQVAGHEISPVVTQEGKNYCLLIAAQNYDDTSIPSLENPIADAIKLKLILKNSYNFVESNISTLFNPANTEIKKHLLELGSTLQPEDNLLIFYAGHGIWVEKEKKGYWLLTDSKYKDVNTWLPNKDVLDLIAKLPSRHTLLITDACFSGSVFKTRGIKDAPPAIREMENKITRVAITSGNDTEVPDESVFMKYLVKALSDNKDKYLTAQKMFINQILEAVMTETKTEPRYGTLELAGHVGGDFIFSKK